MKINTLKSIIAVLLLLSTVGLIVLLVFVKPPDGANDMLQVMIGSLSASFIFIINQVFEKGK